MRYQAEGEAHSQASSPQDTPPIPLLLFQLGDERYALDAESVLEVVRAVAISPLPKAPAIVDGVVNYRGVVVPVLDIRRRFGREPVRLSPDQHFIVARAGRRDVALRVDSATELIEVSASRIVAGGDSAPGAKYLDGIARLDDGLVIISDLEAFLSLDEARTLDDALAGAEIGTRAPGTEEGAE